MARERRRSRSGAGRSRRTMTGGSSSRSCPPAEAVAQPVDEPGAGLGRGDRLAATRRRSRRGLACGAPCLIGLAVEPLVAVGEVGGDEVADRHVEVEQQPDDREQDEHDPRAGVADRAVEQSADAEADGSAALAGRCRLGRLRPRRGGTSRAARAPRPPPRVAAIQRSAGIVFIHSMSANPASSGGANAIPHPSSVVEQSCQGGRWRRLPGANSAMTLMIARQDEHKGQALAHEARAQPRTASSAGAAGRSAPRARSASSGRHGRRQTSITIGRIIGRRLVRWWKKRLSVSRIFVFT